MNIKLGLRYKTRNGRLAFVCLHDPENNEKYRFCGVIASTYNNEVFEGFAWLENGKCTDHRRKVYYSDEGFSNMEDFLSQYDLVECIDEGKQLNLFGGDQC